MKKKMSLLWKVTLILICVIFSVSLASYILAGTTSRYLQDDYCYDSILARNNFLAAQVNSYLHETTYSSERFSLTLGMALTRLAGPTNVRFLPGVMLVAWLVGLYLVINRSLSLGRMELDRLEIFVLAESIALFTLSMAPNWIQSFYWRAAMLPYFAPIVSGTFLVLLLLHSSQPTKRRPWLLIGVFFISLLTGGFSETAVALENTCLVICLVIVCFLRGNKWRRILPIIVALIGSMAALLLLLYSPSNAVRLSRSFGVTASLQSVLVNSLNGGLYFYRATAYRSTLPYSSALLFYGLMGLAISSRLELPSIPLKKMIVGLVMLCGMGYLMTVATMAPHFYVEASYPGNRALIISRFVSICLAAMVGLMIGSYMSNQVAKGWRSYLVVLAGIMIVFVDGMWLIGMDEFFTPLAYPDIRSFLTLHIGFGLSMILASTLLFFVMIRWAKVKVAFAVLFFFYLLQPALMGAHIFSEYPILRQRAAMADWREAQIIMARDSGAEDITVRALDSLVGIAELSDNAGFWVNNCAAWYYGVKSIRAVEPVLDPVTIGTP